MICEGVKLPNCIDLYTENPLPPAAIFRRETSDGLLVHPQACSAAKGTTDRIRLFSLLL